MKITYRHPKLNHKIRLYPMKLTDKDMKNWLTHPEIVKLNLHIRIKKDHPLWDIKSYCLDPNLDRQSYRGLPMLPTKDEWSLVVVEVPESEDDNQFVSGGIEVHY